VGLLHGEALSTALVGIGLDIQRAKTLPDVLRQTTQALTRLGYQAFLSQTSEIQSHLLPLVTSQWVGPTSGARCYLPPDLAACPAAILCPLESGPRVWGLLGILHAEITEEDVNSFSILARHVTVAIEAAEALRALERRTAERDFVDILTRTPGSANLSTVLEPALLLLRRSTNADAAALHRFDSSTEHFDLVGEASGYQGRITEVLRQFSRRDTAGIALAPIARPVRELVVPGAQEVAAAGFKHLGLVPLVLHGTCLGLVTLARYADRQFLSEELASAELLGVHLAAHLERSRLAAETTGLYNDLKASYDRLAKTQAELVKHERLAALGELAAVMAHEVRNPLGVIFNSLATLRRLPPLGTDAEVLLTMVGEEADRLNRIVGDLLDFARPYEVSKKPIQVCALIASAATAAQAALEANHITVRIPAPDSCPPLTADGQLLRQALVNLVVNGIQAMPRGGTLRVDAKISGNWYVLEVRDEGVGLSHLATERLFQPFFTTKATGTGLGLAVVKRIVEAHHGDISTLSHNPGTTFRIRLPRAEASA
jgi:signal transduction histidine kinase